jgi:amino acid adenylation domain-containing protein
MPSVRNWTVQELCERQSAQAPAAAALLFKHEALTYGELNRRANQLAHRLVRLGAGRGRFVGVCLERSPEAIIGLLAILKAGAAYVPLDPAFPDERLAFMIDDTAAVAIVGHRPTRDRLGALAGRCALVLADDRSEEPTDNPAVGATADDVAYVMYTSGSTGSPKGVLTDHRAVLSRVVDTDYCRFGPEEVFLHLAPLAFDASTFEIWGPLAHGGRLALLPPGLPALDELGAAIRRHGVTTLFLTTALFNRAVDQEVEELGDVRQLLMGGELVSPRHVRKALALLRGGTLLHVYGPTESTTFATCFPMPTGYATELSVPIGRPIAHTTVHILDEQLHPAPAGTPGELYIGGDGLARGYLNNPELTRQKFIVDPFSRDAEARLYRTGDRACYRPDGNIEFLGRFDDQVKILGHRIEPGEIEAALRQHPLVREAAVIARRQPSGDKQLVAYVVPVHSESFSADELKSDLAQRLPRYMVPVHVVCLESLPLNVAGKVDRAALPAPEDRGPASAASGSATEMEGQVAAIWGRILSRPVGLDETFFDLGGTSLGVLQMQVELSKTLGRQVGIPDLFKHVTVRSLAAWLAGGANLGAVLARARDRANRQQQGFARQHQVKRGQK